MTHTHKLVFGGSFDPPTLAHVQVAHEAMLCTSSTEVIFVPAFHSPLKSSSLAEPAHRIAMLEIALSECPWASIESMELQRGGPSFTIDTLESMQQDNVTLQLLIGADQWKQFEQWHRHQDILSLANPVVIPRDGFQSDHHRCLQINPINCSSTAARKAIEQNTPTEHLLKPAVLSYITTHGLYQLK